MRKINRAMSEYTIETQENVYAELREGDSEYFRAMSEFLGLTYDEENYILFSDGKDKYSLRKLFKHIQNIVDTEIISVNELRKCHFMFNYLTLWDKWENTTTEEMCDFENYLCEAISLAKSKDFDESLYMLSRAYEMKEEIEYQVSLM